MNLFACDRNPIVAARSLPDKHIVKMCIENAQMLAVAVGGLHGMDWGTIRKKDGSPYSQKAHFNHPSTKWVRASLPNLAWTIQHGLELCSEFEKRYGHHHASLTAHHDASCLFTTHAPLDLSCFRYVKHFARAMPAYIKHDMAIDDVQAYRKYLVIEKPWATWKIETRKPTWWNIHDYADAVYHGVPRALQDGREV